MQNEMQRGAFALAGQLQEDGLQEVAHGPARLRRALCCSTWLNSSFGWLFTRHPRFHFLTIKVLHPHLHAAPWLYVKKWNRKADRRHVWLFFFFFFFFRNHSLSSSARVALCCLPNGEAAAARLLLFQSGWCGAGKQSVCHGGIQMPRT